MKQLPILVLKKDSNGYNAIERAALSQKPRAQDIMIMMLTGIQDFLYTKNIIKKFIDIMGQENDISFQFLDKLIIEPATCKGGLTVPWEIETEELIFSSHTTLISEQLINEQTGLTPEDMHEEVDDGTEDHRVGLLPNSNKRFTPQ